MVWRLRATLCGVTWLALALRLPGLFANTFAADEALFASWARFIAVWRDPLLQWQPVDKPPLLFYTQALFYPLFGPVAWAARLPNLLASLLLVPLVGVWAWQLYRREETAVGITILAALFVALSPLAIQFSATAFIDPLLLFWLTAALVQMPRRAAVSGLLFGLALATKYQAVLYAPLLVGFAWRWGWTWPQWRRWLRGLAPVLAALLLWDVARAGADGLWSAQMQNYGGLRLIWSWELWPRALAWLRLGRWFWGNGWLFALFGVGLLWLYWRAATGADGDKRTRADVLLLLFLPAYALLHWLLAIPIWDRYLLPLLPLIALLTARMASSIVNRQSLIVNRQSLFFPLVVALLLPGAWGGMHGRFPIGGQRTADQGAEQVAAYLADAPYGTVLYDHWWSWQWRYHLFDRRVYVSWTPHPAALTADLRAFGDDGAARYLALPTTAVGPTAVALPWQRAVTAAGFHLSPAFTAGEITLYRIYIPTYNKP